MKMPHFAIAAFVLALLAGNHTAHSERLDEKGAPQGASSAAARKSNAEKYADAMKGMRGKDSSSFKPSAEAASRSNSEKFRDAIGRPSATGK